MASAGGHWIKTDPGRHGQRYLSAIEAQASGYDRAYDALNFDQIAKRMPGATAQERLKNALDDVLGRFGNNYDAALQALREEGPGGLLAFTGQGDMVGPRALAGAMRAARQNPELHRLATADEVYTELGSRSRAAKEGARNRRPKSVIAKEKADLERRRDELERTLGTRDLRKAPTGHKQREEDLRSRDRARRESHQRAVREANKARQAAEKAARKKKP